MTTSTRTTGTSNPGAGAVCIAAAAAIAPRMYTTHAAASSRLLWPPAPGTTPCRAIRDIRFVSVPVTNVVVMPETSRRRAAALCTPIASAASTTRPVSSSTRRFFTPPAPGSGLLEVDALDDRQPLQVAPQAIERHLDGAEAHPFTPAHDAAAARGDVGLGRDRQADRAAELDAIGAVVEVHERAQHVGGAGRAARGLGDGLGRLPRDLGGRGVEPDGGGDLGEVAGHDPAAKRLLGAGQVGHPGGDLTAGERLDDAQRGLAARQLGEDHALQRLVVLGQDEVAEPLAHLGL